MTLPAAFYDGTVPKAINSSPAHPHASGLDSDVGGGQRLCRTAHADAGEEQKFLSRVLALMFVFWWILFSPTSACITVGPSNYPSIVQGVVK